MGLKRNSYVSKLTVANIDKEAMMKPFVVLVWGWDSFKLYSFRVEDTARRLESIARRMGYSTAFQAEEMAE